MAELSLEWRRDSVILDREREQQVNTEMDLGVLDDRCRASAKVVAGFVERNERKGVD